MARHAVRLFAAKLLSLNEASSEETVDRRYDRGPEEFINVTLCALGIFDDVPKNREISTRICGRLSEADALLARIAMVDAVHRCSVSELVEDWVGITAASVSDMCLNLLTVRAVAEVILPC